MRSYATLVHEVDEIVATMVEQCWKIREVLNRQRHCPGERGWKGWNFSPSPTLENLFLFELLSTASFHCQNLMKINSLHALKGPCRFYKGLRGPIPGSREPNLGSRGPLKTKVGGKLMVFISGRGPTPPGALPWLISPSPELWLHHWEQTEENQVMRMLS